MEGEKGPQGGEADLALAVSPNYPVARVKRIIRSDPEIKLVSADALYLITKATELFVDALVKESFKETQKSKRKNIKYEDISHVVKEREEFEFLLDIIPEKKTVAAIQRDLEDAEAEERANEDVEMADKDESESEGDKEAVEEKADEERPAKRPKVAKAKPAPATDPKQTTLNFKPQSK